jgi:hypothetical protein
MRTRRKRYSAEFKREALKRACEEGMTDVQVSEEPGCQHSATAALAGPVATARFLHKVLKSLLLAVFCYTQR